jgi:hypothetical protein
LGGEGGTLPRAVTSTDKLAFVNSESGRLTRTEAATFSAAAVDDDVAWGCSRVVGARETSALRPDASNALKSLASNRKDAVRKKEYLRGMGEGNDYKIQIY